MSHQHLWTSHVCHLPTVLTRSALTHNTEYYCITEECALASQHEITLDSSDWLPTLISTQYIHGSIDIGEYHRKTARFPLCRLLSQGHVAFLETVPFRAIVFFTVLQFLGLAAVYVVASWTGVSTLPTALMPH